MLEELSRKMAVGFTLAVALGACGGGMDVEGTPLQLGVTSMALQHDGDPPDPHDAFLHGGPLVPSSGTDIVHTLDPAVCSDTNATFITISRDTQRRYRTLAYHSGVRANSWGSYGTKTFASGPTCAMRDPASNGRRFVLAGKGEDNKIWYSLGRWSLVTSGGIPSNPVADTAWTQLDPESTYSAHGAPALTSGPTSLLLAAIGDANQVFAYYHALPYSSPGANWIKFEGPALPAGAVVLGRPAVEHFTWFTPPAGYYGIAVRVALGGIHRILVTFFNGDGSGFSGFFPGSTPDWTEWPVNAIIDSDPAMTFSPNLGAVTLYFKEGNQLLQTSHFLASGPIGVVLPEPGYVYDSAPSALAGPTYEGGGTQVVVARTRFDNKVNFIIARTDDELIP